MLNISMVFTLQVDGVDYFGEGCDVDEAKNDTAWSALRSIWDGEHQQKLEEKDEYWYDDSADLDFSSSATNSCCCDCHHCDCCDELCATLQSIHCM